MTMYRMVSVGGGAFEHSAPSLGSFFTKLTLRFQYWAFASRMANVGHRAWDRADAPLQHYVLLTVLEVYAIEPVRGYGARRYD